MAKLASADRARLPDRSFAYIDPLGRRRLPIHDEAHVRNALARFNQVSFHDAAARDQALTRVLKAAKRYRIVPVGFVDAQLRQERSRASSEPGLPSGFVTLLFTDIEGSTGHVARLGDRYGALLDEVLGIQRAAVLQHQGHLVEVRADELFAAFGHPAHAVRSALAIQRALAAHSWADGVPTSVRIGVHAGYPTSVPGNYIGMAVHVAARVASCAHGGQVVITGDTRTALTGCMPQGVRLRNLGPHRLRGIPGEVALYQLVATGLAGSFPPLRGAQGSG
jgi:class 3 adenylate cyclase